MDILPEKKLLIKAILLMHFKYFKNYMLSHNTFCKVLSKNFQKWAQREEKKKKLQIKQKKKKK